jgi:hypothetical protein
MESVGLLIVFSVVAAAIFAKARVPGGAVIFSLIALVLFVGTPVGQALPGLFSDLVSAVSDASEPLTGGSEPVG